MHKLSFISNNCLSGELCKKLNLQIQNPLTWGLIYANDFIKLFRFFDSINFYKIKMNRLTAEIESANNGINHLAEHKIVGLNIDDIFNIYFTHYLYDKQCLVPTKSDVNILYYRNFEYTYNTYMRRVERMLVNNYTPVFFVLAFRLQGWTEQTVQALLDVNSNYNLFLATDFNVTAKDKNQFIHIENELLHEKYHYRPAEFLDANFNIITTFLSKI